MLLSVLGELERNLFNPVGLLFYTWQPDWDTPG